MMRTIPCTDRALLGWRGGSQMSKFEQVYSDDHQMSLAQGPRFTIQGSEGGELGSGVRGQGGCCNIAQFRMKQTQMYVHNIYSSRCSHIAVHG